MTIQPVNFDSERLGLTSASSALADTLCPGRFLMQRGLPDTDSHDARSGTLTHAAMEVLREGHDLADGIDGMELTSLQAKCATRAIEIERWAVAQWLGDATIGYSQFEARLWAVDEHLRRIHSGKLDAFWISEQRALIEDFKSLFSEAPDAPSNLQLRDEAALLYENFGIRECTVFINQPLVHWKTEDVVFAVYDEDDLERASAEMRKRVKRSHDPSSPRVPGLVQCQYCRARRICPESQQFFGLVERPSLDIDAFTPEQRAEWVPKLQLIRDLAAESLDLLTERLSANPDYIAGYHLKPGRLKHPITDPQTLFERLRGIGVTGQEFAGQCVTVGKEKVERLVKAKTKLKGRELDARLRELLDGCTTEKQDKPSLATL